MEKKEPVRVKLSTVIIFVLIIVIIGLVSVIITEKTGVTTINTVNNIQTENILAVEEIEENKIENMLTVEENKIENMQEFLEEKYFMAIANIMQKLEYKHTEGDPYAEIKNYDEVVNSVFTGNGRNLFREEAVLIEWKDNIPYMYASADYRGDYLLDVSFEKITQTEDTISAIAVRTMINDLEYFELEESEKENVEKYIFKDKFVLKLVDGKWLVDYYVWGDIYETIEEYISKTYIGIDTLIPEFDDINKVENDWIWECAHQNFFAYGEDPGISVTKEQIENSAKEVFGNKFNKEFPEEGLEFWLEPQDGEYFVASAGIESDYFNEFRIKSIEKEDNEVVVTISEYKISDIWHNQTILEICNINTNEVIETIDISVDEIKEEEQNSYLLYLSDIKVKSFVQNNPEKFSEAKIIFEIEEETGNYYIKSVER